MGLHMAETPGDEDPGRHLADEAETDEGGRGLYLVDQLATRWGSRPTKDGKAVWFEVPVGPARDAN